MVVLGTEIFTIPGSQPEKLRKNVFVTDYHFQLFFHFDKISRLWPEILRDIIVRSKSCKNMKLSPLISFPSTVVDLQL